MTRTPAIAIDDANTPGSRLRRLARAPRTNSAMPRATPVAGTAAETEERCGLCGAVVPEEHRHLLDFSARRLVCACRACAVLFNDSSAGGRHYRLIPDRCNLVTDFELSDVLWAELGIPVDVAFFFFDTAAARIVALYPGAMGVTESQLPLNAWTDLVACNPVLEQMEKDVEALLVRRTLGVREYWLAPVDTCYALAGVIRQHWKGLAGGEEVWLEIDKFFDGLRARATRVRRNGGRTALPLSQEDAAR